MVGSAAKFHSYGQSEEHIHVQAWRAFFYLGYAAAHRFLNETDLPWFIRTTYDVYLHLPNLIHFINELDLRYDPLRDIVLKGELIERPSGGFAYIHGGPGWIMSRAAVKAYVELEKEVEAVYISKGSGDDITIVNFTGRVGLRRKETFSNRFCGLPIRGILDALDEKRDFSLVKENCSTNPEFRQHIKLKDIAFLHNGQEVNWAVKIGDWLIRNAPDDVYIEATRFWANLCRLREHL
jgi:hypothetical protein